jgi:hypothetical protein
MSTPEAWHVTRTFRAMELHAVRPRSAPELADALGVHARTARRLLKRLESEGYVTPTGDRRRRHRPTMRVVAPAGQVGERAELTAKASPHVAALRDRLGESCHLCVPSHLFALCLVHAQADRADGPRPHLREPWRDAVLAQRLEAFTGGGPTFPQPGASTRQEGVMFAARAEPGSPPGGQRFAKPGSSRPRVSLQARGP